MYDGNVSIILSPTGMKMDLSGYRVKDQETLTHEETLGSISPMHNSKVRRNENTHIGLNSFNNFEAF